MTRHPDPQKSLIAAFLFACVLTLIFTLYLLAVSAWVIGNWAMNQAQTFIQASGSSVPELIATGYAGWSRTPLQTNGRKNILILGLDSLSTRGDAPPLTDTMIVVSIDLQTGTMNALSFPRDLWQPDYQSRINALYYYGLERDPAKPYRFPQEVMSHMIGVPIHHTVVLKLEEVAQLIDLVGGITVDVPAGFVDTQFPRPDVDVTTERDPAKLYQTVEFQAGPQIMTGSRALEYIRSRKSEGETGGDGARTNRQQQVISALLSKISQPTTLSHPQRAGQLYAFYQQNFAQYLPMTEAIATAKALWPVRDQIRFVGHGLSVYPTEQNGVLVHPSLAEYFGQWVYVVRDPALFDQEIKTALDLPE